MFRLFPWNKQNSEDEILFRIRYREPALRAHRLSGPCRFHQKHDYRCDTSNKNLVIFFTQMLIFHIHSFLIYYFTFIVLSRVHFHTDFAWGLHGGVDVKWSGGFFLELYRIDVIVVNVKVSRGIGPFSPMGIYSTDTNQPPNGEICMDKSHLLSNNPTRQ